MGWTSHYTETELWTPGKDFLTNKYYNIYRVYSSSGSHIKDSCQKWSGIHFFLQVTELRRRLESCGHKKEEQKTEDLTKNTTESAEVNREDWFTSTSSC